MLLGKFIKIMSDEMQQKIMHSQSKGDKNCSSTKEVRISIFAVQTNDINFVSCEDLLLSHFR